MNVRKFTALAVLFGVALTVVVPAVGFVTATGGGDGSCTLSQKSGRTIVHFNEHLFADRRLSKAQAGPVNVSLPEGDYKVTLVSYDNHSGKGGQTQT